MCRADLRRVVIALALLSTACRKSLAPAGALPLAIESQRTAIGGWVDVRGKDDASPLLASGELVAVSADSLFVFHGDALRSVALDQVRATTLARYHAPTSPIWGWGVLGILSTASHGFLLIFTAPIWFTVTAATATYVNHQAIVITSNVEVLRPYARFPQGLPSGVERGRLRPAPRRSPQRRNAP